MVNIQNLKKYFSQGEVRALNDISIDIARGEFVVVLGSNGSGKSTFLNAIAGSIIPDSGTIFIDENNVTDFPEHKRSKWISRVFQNPLAGTAHGLTVTENFRLAALRTQAKSLRVGTTPEFKEKVVAKIAELKLGLENKTEQPIGSLSGGQRQALTLIMSVMDDTRLLLMDEPVSSLDPRTAGLVMELADELIKQHRLTTILVTHNLRDAHRYGNRLLLFSEGRIVKDIKNSEKQLLRLDEIYSWF